MLLWVHSIFLLFQIYIQQLQLYAVNHLYSFVSIRFMYTLFVLKIKLSTILFKQLYCTVSMWYWKKKLYEYSILSSETLWGMSAILVTFVWKFCMKVLFFTHYILIMTLSWRRRENKHRYHNAKKSDRTWKSLNLCSLIDRRLVDCLASSSPYGIKAFLLNTVTIIDVYTIT